MEILISRVKLRPPQLPQAHVSRAGLLQKLENGLEKKLTLIVAGAGYGKSTLLAEWAQSKTACIWYSLDAPDRDPALFFAYVLTGLQEKWPELGRNTQAILNRPVLPDPESLMLSLLAEIEVLAALPGKERPLLVFDDYHRLGDAPAVSVAVKLLLERLPPTIHVAISSRTPLEFTARLGAAGQINKLTTHDLRFSDEEIVQILHDQDTTSSGVQHFLRRTEGWAAGLQLLRQAYQQAGSLDLEKSPGMANDPLAAVYAYLAEELFTQQPVALQRFLLQTAILDTFSPDDCNAIFERNDSAHWLTYLTRQNLFTIHLQRAPDVYRYHHLLTDYLRQKIKREKEADIICGWHHRAAAYYHQRQQWGEAFEQAQKARDESLAVHVLVQASQRMLLAGQLNTLEDWLQRFAPKTYVAFPRLYALKGDVWFRQGNYEQAISAYQKAIKLADGLDDQQTLLHGWYGVGVICDRTGERENAASAFFRALEFVNETDKFSHLKVLVGLANNQKSTHQNRKAAEAYCHCLELALDMDDSVQAVVMHNLGVALQEMGEFSDALNWYEKALSLRRKIGFSLNTASSLNSIGLIQCVLGDFEAAKRTQEEASALLIEGGSPPYHASYFLHSRGNLALAKQDFASAEQFYRQSIAIKETLNEVPGLAITWAMMGDLYRRQSDLTEATTFIQRALEPGMEVIGLNPFLLVQTVLAQILLDQGDIEQAVDVLVAVIEGHGTKTENKYELAKCLWLLARAQYILGQPARETLVKALALTQRWGYHFLLYTLAREFPDLLAEGVAADLYPLLVADLLKELGETAVPPLVQLLQSPETEVQIRAIQRLVTLGVDGVWQPLATVARSKNISPPVKQEARKALDKLRHTPPTPLFVTTLGAFTLRRGDQLIPDSAWGSRKAQTLFKYLLERAGMPVCREDLVNLFWPETLDDAQAWKRAHNNLNQLASWLRQALEPYLPSHYPSRYLIPDKETYLLKLPEGSQVDMQLFEELIAKAAYARRAGDADAMLAYYYEGAALYRGDYLVENRGEDWCIRRREQLQRQAIHIFYELADTNLMRDELETAVSYARRLLQIEPWHEKGCAILIEALVKLGQNAEARRACHECKEKLKTELEVSDSPLLDELYRQIPT